MYVSNGQLGDVTFQTTTWPRQLQNQAITGRVRMNCSEANLNIWLSAIALSPFP
jgi:hypothetical protein